MKVSEIMSSHVETCTPQHSLAAAAKLMEQCDCGAIPVVESQGSNKLVGIITDRDITIRAVAHGRDPATLHVLDCMSGDLSSVSPETDIEQCLNLMEQKQVRRMPVIDDQGRICGIIAQADIAEKADAGKIAELVREVSEPHNYGSAAYL